MFTLHAVLHVPPTHGLPPTPPHAPLPPPPPPPPAAPGSQQPARHTHTHTDKHARFAHIHLHSMYANTGRYVCCICLKITEARARGRGCQGPPPIAPLPQCEGENHQGTTLARQYRLAQSPAHARTPSTPGVQELDTTWRWMSIVLSAPTLLPSTATMWARSAACAARRPAPSSPSPPATPWPAAVAAAREAAPGVDTTWVRAPFPT